MTKILSVSLLALAMAACASGVPREVAGPAPQNQGMVTLGGISAAQALGAVDTSKLVGAKPETVTANQPSGTAMASSVGATSETAIAVEGVSPASVLAAIDTSKLIGPGSTEARVAPAVQAAASKKGYTTEQLSMAQLEAIKKQ
ncbi:MAG: hypothetical protein Q8R82_19580 [Hyphomonadaceae bacterium]|nr:hypothetical protein [Hyphomonadaceae bacterium]